ncbi:Hypothetical protein HDN1F_28150 [gamma proteobacterium HdN1]|nr:Hypothetical protein HDN1F_28150 [gamma proteobacterium HdN1]
MKHLPTVASTMTPFPHAVESNETLGRAREMMKEHGFHHLPVMEGGELVGILSEHELRHLYGPFSGVSNVDDLVVKDVCNTRVLAVDIHDRLAPVLAMMVENRTNAAVVMRMGKLAGILTARDAMRRFAEVLEALRPTSGDDDAA